MAKLIVLSSRAQNEFKKLSKSVQDRIIKSLKNLASGSERLDIKKLKGVDKREDLYRLRIGDYRITYYPEQKEIKIIRIDHRRKGYKWLD